MTVDKGTELKLLASCIAHAPNPHTKRDFLWKYLGLLYKAAEDAHPSLRMHATGDSGYETVVPVLMLQEALREADDREVPEFFQDAFEPSASGGPKRPSRDRFFLSLASAVITALEQKYGLSKTDAAKRVVRHLRDVVSIELPTRSRNQLADWQSMLEWRDKCASGAEGEFEFGIYEMYCRLFGCHEMPWGSDVSQALTAEQLLDVYLSSDTRPHDPVKLP